MGQPVQNKEYTLGQLLTDTWELFINNFKLFILIILVISVPIQLIGAIFPADNEALVSGKSQPTFWDYGFANMIGTQVIILAILITLAGILLPIALTYAVKARAETKEIDFKQALQQAFARWPSAIKTSLLMGILLIGLFIMLIIPGVIFSIFWVFALFAVALDDKSGMSALRYSKNLVSGRWWKVFGYLIVFGIIAAIINFMITWPISFIGSNYITDVVTAVFSDIINAFFMIAAILLYLNLRQLKPQQKPNKQLIIN